jgi:hypothetical protein
LGDEMKKKEMGWACCTYGDRRGAYRVLGEDPREGNDLEDLGTDGRLTVKLI